MATANIFPKVLVTGASGFIGLHTTLHLLKCGYRVRATVRTEAREKKTRDTLTGYTDTGSLEFAYADLSKDDGWQEAVHGCTSVIHTAAPYPIENPKEANELILPIRDGTLRVLRASQAEGIHRVVLLSNVGSIFDGHQGENRTFDESDWTDVGKCLNQYHIAKTLSERAAWDFIQSPENHSKMEMVAINPSAIFGPVLDDHRHTSVEWIRTVMRAEVPGLPRMLVPLVDVRDLVDILTKAMTVPDAAGKRFICDAAEVPYPELAEILHNNFSQRGYHIPTRVLPDILIRLIALFNPKVKAVAGQLNWNFRLSTERVRSVFGWEPRPYQQTIIEMAESLIEHGLV
jgi:nucleoside-diphosphate-sugar epimerase